MVKIRSINIILVFIFLVSVPVFAEQRELYNTASYLARGKAMVADVDDYNVLFVNPAGIPLIKERIINFEFLIEGSSGISDNLTAFFGYNSDKYWKITDTNDLTQLKGKNTRGRVGFLGTYITDLISFAVIANGMLDSFVNTVPTTKDTVFSTADVAVQFGIAKSFFEKKNFRIGGTGKAIYRGNRSGIFDTDQLQSQSIKPVGNLYANEGLAFSMDLGTQYTWFIDESEFSIGLAALDLSTPFGIQPKIFGDGNTGRPEILPARINFGFGYKVPNLYKGLTLRTNLDIIKSAAKKESSFQDMIHMGIELKFPQFLSLRAGLNQLYWTAGIGVSYWVLDASFATYVENTSIYEGDRTPSNRRYVFQVGFYF